MITIGSRWYCSLVIALTDRQSSGRGAASSARGSRSGRQARPHRPNEADPLALLNQAVDDGVTSIQNAKKGLENYRALILSVQRQVESGEKEKARLEARIQEAARRRRSESDRRRIRHDAGRRRAEHLTANREQLPRHKETYENFAKQVEIGQSQVLAARQKATRLGLGTGAKQTRKGDGPVRPRLLLRSRTD